MGQDDPRSMTRFVLASFERGGAFITASELHQRIHRGGYPIGLSTVYRALGRLRRRGLVDVLVDEHGQRRYRHCSTSPHHHLVCSACHSAVEIPAPASPLPDWAPDEAPGFTDVLVRVTITGVCADCKAGLVEGCAG